ncbi:MAG: 6-carboxytetrahydropterin synthase [Rhodospirillaceae bacterium]|mgnify:FL=1|jgi:6-pyruvoyltetrahydropterin/6-carboxytetrahydropterin synthase|nr:6-carboxytetrahydropterin synthase [Rhodospirillaceae bacterium]MBT5245170.1 6-carboxytetrahydropterin synthase [Rhodospirillaceae bacterium]MBT6241986.1 6-carboxytetrahydropterin synthase [Rhodospirillaceae bacterium]
MANSAVVHREIGIDCGHRVPDHASKCRSPHGHRYRIIATCTGDVLEKAGEAEHGMVIDFGHIKQFMMDLLDAIFDHAFVVAGHDEVLMNMYFPGEDPEDVITRYFVELENQLEDYCQQIKRGDNKPQPIQLPKTLVSKQDPDGMKIVPVSYTPTAENMAKHMFELMDRVMSSYYRADLISMTNIRLYETPNGSVDYPAGTTILGLE